jgi:rhodanese-related sulfurtransferase
MNQAHGIPSVDVHEAASRAGADGPDAPVILDVREPDEVATVRIDGGLHVPMSALTARVDEIPRDRPLLVLCAMGSRSAAVTGFLLRSGWTDVTNIDGGITAWERAGLPVRRGA